MKTMMKTAGAATLLAMAVAGTTAMADPLETLYFSQNAGWLDPLVDFDTGAGMAFEGFSDDTDQTGDGAPADTYKTMSWRGTEPTPVSSIDITGYTEDNSPLRFKEDQTTPDADGEWNAGDWWVITELLQINNVLQLNTGGTGIVPDPLWIADTLANLYIYSDDAETMKIFEDLNSKVQIEFWETYNTFADCRFSPTPLGTQCDDVFRVTEADFDPVKFWYDGVKYSIDFAVWPGPSTNQGAPAGTSLVCPNPFDARCDDVDVTKGETWVFTPEYNPGTSSIFVAAQWRVLPIPEPSIVGLFGVGMLALGLAGRRRKQVKKA